MEDVQSWLTQPNTGTVETAAAPFWRLALNLDPNLKIVTIRRDPVEAAQSAINAGLGDNLDNMIALFKYLDHKLGQIEKRTKCLSIRYKDLRNESVCKELFEHLLPYEHDSAHWKELDKKNIQIDVPALKRYLDAYSVQLSRLTAIAGQKSFALLTARRSENTAGLTVGFEPLASLLRDGKTLMQSHCAEVGEHPDNFQNKNLELLQRYEDLNALQVTVARSNGRVFGYLVSIMGESLEVPGRISGCHTAFHASSDYPGLGLKLQRKAAEGLRERGIHEVVMRAGIRGAGDRVSTLYKRIGAEPFGTYYRLQLSAA